MRYIIGKTAQVLHKDELENDKMNKGIDDADKTFIHSLELYEICCIISKNDL